MIHFPLLLAAAVLGGIPLNSNASFCQDNRLSMGGFDPAVGSVTLCEKNLKREKNSYLNVIKHELAHVVQHRMGRNGDALMPSALLAPLVRELLPQKEVMAVLMQYPNHEINGELEARLASRYIPSELIAVAVVATRNWGQPHGHQGGALVRR